MDGAGGAQRHGHYSGDLGRRVVHRRTELGLTIDDVAERAAMAPGYVTYVERNPANLSQSALTRLARALETTPGALLGTKTAADPGGGHTYVKDPVTEPMGTEECMDLLSSGGLGRIAFVATSDGAPEVLPVNYALVAGEIVFRTAESGFIAAELPTTVSFQTDRLHGVFSQGWSVLVKAEARMVEDAEERENLAAVNLRPWAGGVREAYVALTPLSVTGRRIISGEAR